jgi:hypothetical protein
VLELYSHIIKENFNAKGLNLIIKLFKRGKSELAQKKKTLTFKGG